jgi:signal transduction histidine kinase
MNSMLQWFTGGERQYMTLLHCMRHDVLWITITIALDIAVATGYILIAGHWWRNQRRVAPSPARRALGNIRNIFIFCGICGYMFIPVKVFWPAWRLYDIFMVALAYVTWRYALQAKDLKVIYTELGRSTKLAADLEKSQDESRRKSHFLNALSHDLRTPLNVVSLQAQMARMATESNDTETLKHAIHEIDSAAQVTAELLNSLLQCARLDWIDEPNNVSEFELAGLLRTVAGACDADASRRGLELRVSSPAGAAVRSDRVKIERVLLNLVSNAVKFTETGSVRVVAECASDALEVHVIDTGIGLSPQQQERLFEDFYQAGNHERDSRKGFGLGLSISRKLARQLGGDIEVSSSPGRGSRFSLLLPGVVVSAAERQQAGNGATAGAADAALGNLNVAG